MNVKPQDGEAPLRDGKQISLDSSSVLHTQAYNTMLHDVGYDHPSEFSSCSQCDNSRLKNREPRVSEDPNHPSWPNRVKQSGSYKRQFEKRNLVFSTSKRRLQG